MSLFVKFFCFLIVCSTYSHATVDVKKRIQHEKQRIEQRYTSFIKHQEQKKKLKQKRRSGIAVLKKQRIQDQKLYEAARKKFVKKRKINKPTSKKNTLEEQYLKKLENEKKSRDKARKDYKALQNSIKDIKTKNRTVSLEAQLGLED